MNIQQVAIKRALAMLDAANAQYKIITADGEEYGELEAVAPGKPKRGDKYGWGVVTEYVKGFIGDLEVGQVVVIPPHEVIAIPDLQATASSWATRNWGKGCCMTTVHNNAVEVMRLQ